MFAVRNLPLLRGPVNFPLRRPVTITLPLQSMYSPNFFPLFPHPVNMQCTRTPASPAFSWASAHFPSLGGGGGRLTPSLLAVFRLSYFVFRFSTFSGPPVQRHGPGSTGTLACAPIHDRQCNVTGPLIGCTNSTPVRLDSSKLAFNPKYHLAGRSASSISISRGLCFNPSACWIIVS